MALGVRDKIASFRRGEKRDRLQAPGPEPEPEPETAPYHPPIVDQNETLASNVEWNRQRWGQRAGWEEHDRYGYQWSGGYQHLASGIARSFDEFFRPYTDGRYDLRILEISPGAGRSTAEFARYASSMVLVDLNPVSIDICRDRFKHWPDSFEYHVNDGSSLDQVADHRFDLVASYDSLVHVHPTIVRGYLSQAAALLEPGGVIWFDTSGKGQKDQGRRTAVTSDDMREWAHQLGLELVAQHFRNDWDCITVARKPA